MKETHKDFLSSYRKITSYTHLKISFFIGWCVYLYLLHGNDIGIFRILLPSFISYLVYSLFPKIVLKENSITDVIEVYGSEGKELWTYIYNIYYGNTCWKVYYPLFIGNYCNKIFVEFPPYLKFIKWKIIQCRILNKKKKRLTEELFAMSMYTHSENIILFSDNDSIFFNNININNGTDTNKLFTIMKSMRDRGIPLTVLSLDETYDPSPLHNIYGYELFHFNATYDTLHMDFITRFEERNTKSEYASIGHRHAYEGNLD